MHTGSNDRDSKSSSDFRYSGRFSIQVHVYT
jgi:hypothetical protein